MKLVITILLLLTSYASAFKAAEVAPIKLIVNQEVIVSTVDSEVPFMDIFDSVNYNTETTALEFTSCYEISIIRIYNETGQLDFELQIKSKIIILNKSLFGKGKYMLGFEIKDVEYVHLTHVNFL